MYDLVQNMGQIPPCEQFRLGHQNDGSGHYYCVVVDTPQGRIPGKGKQGEAWYSHGGKEHSCRNFSFLTAHPGSRVTLEKSRHGPPPGALATGYQNDSGTYYSVVCHHTGHGKVPGKSDGNHGWYSWGGKEHQTRDFSYVVVRGGFNPSPIPTPVPGFNPNPIPTPVPGFNPAPVPGYVPGYNPGSQGGFYPSPPQYPPTPGSGYAPQYPGHSAPPAQGLAQGMVVRFACKSGKNLRLKGCGEVDGHGGNGKFTTFTVHVMGQGRYSFQNQNGHWLAVKYGRITQSPTYGDPDRMFLVHLNSDNSVSLESGTFPGSFVGVKGGGASKLARAGKPSTKLYLNIV